MNWKAPTKALVAVAMMALAAGCGPMADPSSETGPADSPQEGVNQTTSSQTSGSQTSANQPLQGREVGDSPEAVELGANRPAANQTPPVPTTSTVGASDSPASFESSSNPSAADETSAIEALPRGSTLEVAAQMAADRPLERPAPNAEEAPAARASFQFPGRKQKQQDLTFDDLKFPMEKGGPFDRSMLTETIESLAGKEIKIRGYMLPAFQQSGITNFILVRDNQECCFGPGAALYDCIRITMDPGETTEYSVRPIAVKGIFEIVPFVGPDGKHLAIFHMRASETSGG
jgi:hypothetical protein